MLKRGTAPYLECSSRGERRLSAFYARPSSLNGRSIEDAYQAAKVFDNGETNLHWRQAKGRKAVNAQECADYYDRLWKEYINEHPELQQIIKQASGLSDMFGKEGNVCQAEILWRIKQSL